MLISQNKICNCFATTLLWFLMDLRGIVCKRMIGSLRGDLTSMEERGREIESN